MTEHADQDQDPDATGHAPSPSSKRSASLIHDFPFEQIFKQRTIGITQRHSRQLTPQQVPQHLRIRSVRRFLQLLSIHVSSSIFSRASSHRSRATRFRR
ncbi:hypothetical protein [Agrobacterium tumefaciens]|uniref:hypothetical protein n=1 Tax=Agrobacterium tumefaciens TaxID=358 RepID=UPI002206313A|nr:hypothetical protein FY128_22730 [Agrobacterium tumefaciens]